MIAASPTKGRVCSIWGMERKEGEEGPGERLATHHGAVIRGGRSAVADVLAWAHLLG